MSGAFKEHFLNVRREVDLILSQVGCVPVTFQIEWESSQGSEQRRQDGGLRDASEVKEQTLKRKVKVKHGQTQVVLVQSVHDHGLWHGV